MKKLWRRTAEPPSPTSHKSSAPPPFPPTSFTQEELSRLGPLLGFAPVIAARYEADTRAERIAHIRVSILIGLIFYNIYNFNSLYLMPDIAPSSLVLRTLLFTPIVLLVSVLPGRLAPRLREAVLGVGMMFAIAVPVTLFSLSTSPGALYEVGQFPLIMVFGCMLLVLRPRWAAASTLVGFALADHAVLVHPHVSPHLAAVLTLQLATASAFVLCGNYRIERAHRLAFLRALADRQRSDNLEADKETLVALTGTDPLTAVPNRRAFDDWLAAWSTNRANAGRPLALLMIDVDHFKRFNDRYGHVEGDACLCEVARVLGDQLREGLDLLSRYGGEEFAVLLPRTEAAEAARVAERLRQGVEHQGLPHGNRGDHLGVVTVSIGISVLPITQGGSAADLIAAADAALYEAKHRGRNTCVMRGIGQGAVLS